MIFAPWSSNTGSLVQGEQPKNSGGIGVGSLFCCIAVVSGPSVC